MGNQKNESQKNTLIDFLYKDMSLINSFYSQIFQGTVTNITKSEISADTTEKEASFGIGFIKSKIASNGSINESVISNINPMDVMILELIEALDVEVVKGSLQEVRTGSLVAINGSLLFRDYKVINDLLPLISETNLIPEFNQPMNPSAKGKNRNFTLGKLMEKLITIMPFGLEFDILTENDECTTVIIKDEYLTVKPNDLMRSYGLTLPSNWTIIGIIDRIPTVQRQAKSDFKSAIDEVTQYYYSAINAEGNDYVIKPVVIYRKI